MSRAHAASTTAPVQRLRARWASHSGPSDARPALRALTSTAALALALAPVRLGEAVASDAAYLLPQATAVQAADTSDPRAYLRERASRDRGWTDREWLCTRALVDRENTSWNPHARNGQESSAYGLFQILHMKPGTPLPRQVDRFWDYLDSRYGGSACAALHHSTLKGWY